MSDRFEIRIGQTWYIRGSNQGNPCDVYITITDIYVAEFFGELKVCYRYDYLFDGELKKDELGFDDLQEQLFEKDWILKTD